MISDGGECLAGTVANLMMGRCFFFFFHWSNKKNLMVYVYISHTYGSTRLPSLESGKGKKIVTMYVG